MPIQPRSVNDEIERNVKSFLDGQIRGVRKFLERCESPLEKLLGSAFLRHCLYEGTFLEGMSQVWECGTVEGYFLGSQNVGYTIDANQKIETGRGCFRPDFLFKVREPDANSYGRVVFLFGVEIDGHDFHERTREQALRDKSRDRSLLHAGLKLLRFTGSEVYHSVDTVLDEIGDFMFEEGKRVGLWKYHTGTVDDWHEKKAIRQYGPDV
jgi:hypothetical protein